MFTSSVYKIKNRAKQEGLPNTTDDSKKKMLSFIEIFGFGEKWKRFRDDRRQSKTFFFGLCGFF